MPGPLKNSRHERFAQELAKGKSQVDAYRAAGYKPNDSHAARAAGTDQIADRVLELKARAAERAVVTAADIAAQLDEDRQFAKQCMQASACVSASAWKAKVLGLIVDQSKVEHAGGVTLHVTSEDASL